MTRLDQHAAVQVYRWWLDGERKLIARNVCPCCYQRLENIDAHIKGRHPNYRKP